MHGQFESIKEVDDPLQAVVLMTAERSEWVLIATHALQGYRPDGASTVIYVLGIPKRIR